MNNHRSDIFFKRTLEGLAALALLLFASLLVVLYFASKEAFDEFGFAFVYTNLWDPVDDQYGALAFIYGTVVSSLIALILAVPVSVGSALFLSELAPNSIRKYVALAIELLAAIPSVVYGLWGIFVFAPIMRTTIQPVLGDYLGFLPLFKGAPFGIGMLSAGIILAIMITPTITALTYEIFRSVPNILREGALALGATRWETIYHAVLKTSISGILGSVILGLGRALGETMAVTMLIGNRADISLSLFEPAATMASVIANEYTEANSDVHLASLTALGLTLFLISLAVSLTFRMIVARIERKNSGLAL